MKTTFRKVQLSSVFKGNKLWSADDPQRNYNNNVITIKYKGKRTSFEFWGSIMKPKISSEEELLYAFEGFLSDAECGSHTFEDFCLAVGYDTDRRDAYKAYERCERSFSKFERVFENEDIYSWVAQPLIF